MNKKEYLDSIESIFRDCLEIAKNKSSDYASEENPFKNFEMSRIVGVDVDRAILVRMADKLSRASNLLGRAEVVSDERLEDTLKDLINYSAILLVYKENCKQVCEEII